MRIRTAIIGLAVVGAALAQPVAGLAQNGADDPPGHDRADDRRGTLVLRDPSNGADDPATHDAGDDNGGGNGADDPATHDAGDDNGGDR